MSQNVLFGGRTVVVLGAEDKQLLREMTGAVVSLVQTEEPGLAPVTAVSIRANRPRAHVRSLPVERIERLQEAGFVRVAATTRYVREDGWVRVVHEVRLSPAGVALVEELGKERRRRLAKSRWVAVDVG